MWARLLPLLQAVIAFFLKKKVREFLTAAPITLTTVSATLVGMNMLIDNLRDQLTGAPPLFLGAVHMYGLDYGISLMLSTFLSIQAIKSQQIVLAHLED